jgi:hypothetical protein
MVSSISRVVAGAFLAFSLSWSSADASVICGPRDALVAALADHYDEKQESVGLSGGGLLMEVFVSASGSWTILLSSPQGSSCIVAAGDSWQSTAKPGPEA